MPLRRTGGFRELQRWQPEAGAVPEEHLEAGGDAFSRRGGRGGAAGWDQFAVNQAKFKARRCAWRVLCAPLCVACLAA